MFKPARRGHRIPRSPSVRLKRPLDTKRALPVCIQQARQCHARTPTGWPNEGR